MLSIEMVRGTSTHPIVRYVATTRHRYSTTSDPCAGMGRSVLPSSLWQRRLSRFSGTLLIDFQWHITSFLTSS